MALATAHPMPPISFRYSGRSGNTEYWVSPDKPTYLYHETYSKVARDGTIQARRTARIEIPPSSLVTITGPIRPFKDQRYKFWHITHEPHDLSWAKTLDKYTSRQRNSNL